MRITVILCTYNRSALLARVLSQLEAQHMPDGVDWDVLVVDNNSSDGTAALARGFVDRNPRFHYLHVAQQGKAWALNAAIDATDREILAFTDDDVELDLNWLAELTRPFEDPKCMGTAGRILPLFNQGQPTWLQGTIEGELCGPLVIFDLGDKIQPLSQAPYGANMAFRREIFARYPRFRTDLGPSGRNLVKGEDVELAGRIIAAGEPLLYVPAALVRHPAERERLQRRYFWKWWFEHGRTTIKTDGIPAGARTYFGVPLYVVRQALTSATRALASRDEKQRLRHLMRLAKACGEVAESLGNGQH